MLHIRTSGHRNAKCKMQNTKSKISQAMANSINLSHPDSNRRYRNFTDSVPFSVIAYLLAPSGSRGLSPPVGNFTLPRVFYYKDREKSWIMQLFLR